jgi:hypothetical protein
MVVRKIIKLQKVKLSSNVNQISGPGKFAANQFLENILIPG